MYIMCYQNSISLFLHFVTAGRILAARRRRRMIGWWRTRAGFGTIACSGSLNIHVTTCGGAIIDL